MELHDKVSEFIVKTTFWEVFCLHESWKWVCPGMFPSHVFILKTELFWEPRNIRKLSINFVLPNNKLIILKHRQLSTLSYKQNKTRPCDVLWQRGKQNRKLRCLWIEFPPSELFHFLRPDPKRLLLGRFPIFLRPNIISRDESNQNIS